MCQPFCVVRVFLTIPVSADSYAEPFSRGEKVAEDPLTLTLSLRERGLLWRQEKIPLPSVGMTICLVV